MNVTTLENLPQQIKENRLKQFGENIVKYQKFKTEAIMKKIDNAGFSTGTLRSYINSGIAYIRTGNKYKGYGDFYKYIDEAIKNHIQPLVPSEENKRLIKEFKKPCINPQTAKDILKQNNQYAVQIGDNIRLLNNLECAKAFTDGLSFMGKTDAKIVKIKIEEAQ